MPQQQNDEVVALDREVIIAATVVSVTCPECGHELDGFVMDPRNADGVSCEKCKADFKVPQNARVVFI